MKSLLLTLLLFSTAAFAADEDSSTDKPLMVGEVDLAAPVSYSEELNDNSIPFDEYYKDEQESKQKVIDAVCNEIKSFPDRMDCIADVSRQFARAGRMRGTLEFVRLNFMHLENEELMARIDELEGLLDHAESFYVGKKPLGVLTRTDLEIEIGEIKQLVGTRNRAAIIADCEKIFGEGHSRCKLP